MQLTEYEQQRAERIQRNQALMKHIGLAEVRHELQSLAQQLRCAESMYADLVFAWTSLITLLRQ